MRRSAVFAGLMLSCLSTVASAQGPTPAPAAASPRPAVDACETSFQHGIVMADTSHSTKGWRVGAAASGVLFSVAGVGGSALVASASAPSPDRVPPDEDSKCFRNGYRTRARAQNRGTAVRSALVGAVVLPAIWLMRSSR